jgi:hypothetical protein
MVCAGQQMVVAIKHNQHMVYVQQGLLWTWEWLHCGMDGLGGAVVRAGDQVKGVVQAKSR